MRAAMIGVCLLALGCNNNGGDGKGPAQKAGPSPQKEGVEWSHKELVDYLKAKGVEFKYIVGGATNDEAFGVFVNPKEEKDIVGVSLRKTAQDAKDRAGG